MMGGFLGAGKTTAIARLARHYVGRGMRVGLVTNDQAYGLVDTQSLRAQGFEVGEVTGACFCCKFNDLVDTAARLSAGQRHDVIIAEPVGSCTDLVATVIEPLRRLYGDQYDVAPLAVLLKPEHGRKILSGEAGLGFSPKAAYIFLKQLEEAEVVAINKIDQVDHAGRAQLAGQLGERFPGKEVLLLSARHGDGFDALIAALDRPAPSRQRTPEVDYDVYAEGEAELGWLNCTVSFRRERGTFDVDELLMGLVRRIARACSLASAEPAHLKVLATADGTTAIANLVSSDATVELSMASGARASEARLIVNARVAVAPEVLVELVGSEVAALAEAEGLTYVVDGVQSFRPGRPVPTHRMLMGQL
jgi:G3E family GTPase